MAKKPPKPAGMPPSPRFKKPSIRSLSTEDLSDETGAEFFAELRTSSDRAAGIMAALVVQDALVKLIRRHLRRSDLDTMAELRGRDGPLHSLYSSTLTAYALGLVDENAKKHLNAIRHIRNAFAHSATPISFKTEAVSLECEKLRGAADTTGVSSARSVYVIACLTLSKQLVGATERKLLQQVASLKRQLRSLEKKLEASP